VGIVTKPYYQDDSVTLFHGDALATLRDLPDESVNCVVTSPPYFALRDYGEEGQYGLEPTPTEYVETMRAVFAEARRVLADDGTLWLNIGDSYTRNPAKGGSGTPNGRNIPTMGYAGGAGLPLPAKNLLGIPWRVAFALQGDGWILRNDIIWHKPNAMPESVTDRLSTRHEHVFMFSKARRYWFDLDPIREASNRVEEYVPNKWASGVRVHEGHRGSHEVGRNPGDVWSIPTQPFPGAHFAVFPPKLAERAILAGCKPGGIVLDPFSGSGTTGAIATKHGRRYVGIDLNADYLDLSLRTRIGQATLPEEIA